MKKNRLKKIIVSLMLVFCSLFFAGCLGSNTESNFVETSEDIYGFYLNTFISAQNGMNSDIDKIKTEFTDQSKIDSAWNAQTKLKVEEMAIIASIQCFNQTSTQKELYLDDGEDGLVVVKKQSSNYVCSLFGEQYSFNINNKSSGQYAISYQKYSQNCSADVKFDSKKSHIMIYIKSYYQNYSGSAERFDEMKDFYNLKNNNTVIRFNTLDGSGSTKTNYAFNIYKRIIDFDLKIARITQKENEIEEENLSTETFTKSTTNDRGGYIFNYNSSSENPTKTSFGDISLW